MSDTAIARIEEFLTYMLQTEAIGGLSVAITDRTRTVHLATHGFADIAARAPVTSSTRFPIGSVGKTFTSVAILQQVESGRLDLHAPVTAYLPWLTLPQHDSPI